MYNLRKIRRKTRGSLSSSPGSPQCADDIKDLKYEPEEVNDYLRYKYWIKAPKRIKEVGLCDNGTYEVETVLDMRQRQNGDGSLEYFVKWKNWSSDFNTWEPEEHMDNCLKLLEDFEKRYVKDKKENLNPYALSKRRKFSRKRNRIKVYRARCRLEDLLRMTNQKEQFTSRILDNLQPTAIYGFPVIGGIQGIRLSWEDGLIEAVTYKEAVARWPSKIKSLYNSKLQKLYPFKLDN